jgi:CRP-like cAMP-binding protein
MSEENDPVKLVQQMMSVPLFEDLDMEQVKHIYDVCDLVEFEKGAVLCQSDTIDEAVYIFISGRLSIQSASGEAFTEIVSTRALGEMGVIIGQPRHSQVVALETSTVLELPGIELQKLIDADPEMGYQLLLSLVKVLYTRTSRANADFSGLKQRHESLRQRLAELAPDDPLLEDRG